MGNKLNTRRRSTADPGDDVTRRRRRKPTRSQSASQVDGRSNRVSMPELGGAVPYKPEDEAEVNIKVYRSYGDLARPKSSTLDRPDYKVYRKSTEGLQKYASLPRHFGRSKSAMDVPNGTLRDDVRRRRELPYNPDYPEIMPRRRSPPESVSSHSSLRGESQRTSKRVSAASSVSSLAKAPVTQDDFPTTEQVKRKLSCFEEQFARSLADKYAGLADTLQLSALPIALSRDPDGGYHHVKLLDYLEGETVPLDLLSENRERYVMMMPEALFHGIMHVRRDKISDLELWTTLARDLVTCIAMEAGNELSRMFEYQIVLLTGDTAVRVLADHAAACVIEYIKRYSSFLDRNTAILGVLRGYPDLVTAGAPKYLSVILGNRELKWEVQDVLKKPGLRKELLLFSGSVQDPDDLYNPWRYYTNKDCQPQLFGYRGMLLEWDWLRGAYRVNDQDLASFRDDVSDPISYPDDFHRLYSPYKVLIGDDVMTRYSSLVAEGRTTDSLAQFVKDLTGGDRSEIRPVYRPLVATPDGVDFHSMNLDNADLTRARLRSADLSRASLNNCTLLLTDLEGAKFRSMDGHQTPLSGTDISYTNLVESTLDQAALEGVTAKHVVVGKPSKKAPTLTVQKPKERQTGTDPDQTDGATNTAKKTRRVPKTLDIRPETNGHRETVIDDPRQQPLVGSGKDDVSSPDNLDTYCVSDSRGNLMSIEKVIEQKQKKLRDRKKKPKKRPVSPLGSTPTEPIPETTVIVQEQVVSGVQGSPLVVEERLQRRQAPAPPTQAIIDPTEEFFKESQSQYQPRLYQSSGQYTANEQEAERSIKENGRGIGGSPEGRNQDNKVADRKETGGDLVDAREGSPGDVTREGVSLKGDSEQVGKTTGKKKRQKG